MSNSSVIIPDEASRPSQRPQSIASPWHTVGVLLLLAALIAASTRLAHVSHIGRAEHRVASYIATGAAEWLITAFIWLGCRSRGVPVRILLGFFAMSARAVLRDIGLALAFLVVANIAVGLIAYFAHPTANKALRNLLPHGPAEIAGYLLLSLTAGVCEEIIFRGYFQRQFAALTKSIAAGIIIQGILFGVSHAYQGRGMMLTISFYGVFFGLLAQWRRSLRPGMIAHFLQDGVGGLLLAKYAPK